MMDTQKTLKKKLNGKKYTGTYQIIDTKEI